MNFNKLKSRLPVRFSQYFYKINPDPSIEVKENIEQFLRSLTKYEIRTLSFLLRICKKHGSDIIFPSQRNMVKIIGCHYNTINKAVATLRKAGFIATRRRYKSSSVYKISEFLLNPFTQSRISNLLPGMRAFALSLLMSSIASASHNCDLVNKSLFGNIEILNSTGRRTEVFVPYFEEDEDREPREENAIMKFAQKIYGKDLISPVVKQLNSEHKFNLSISAQYKLTAFPDEAIVWAMKQINYTKHIRNPYNWLFALCIDYCKDNDIIPDWYFAANLIISNNIPNDAPVYEVNKPIKKSLVVEQKSPDINKKKEYIPNLYAKPPLVRQHARPESYEAKQHPVSKPIPIPQRKVWQPETRRKFGKSIATPTLSPIQEQFAARFPVPEFLKNSNQRVD